ncbi:MAG: radical SAM protein [Lachnospiraceae bacterium]|nr:radical SAM protein [Lachnospiraceae bacterium]
MDSIENILENCRLCARSCGADRIHGEAGRCGGTDKVFAARSALHMWEEPCISGKEGSGAVFFSGCPLGCVFCQNRSIALGKAGKEISLARLTQLFLELQEQKANNINLVTPTHYVPQIISAVENARRMGLVIPIVYNTASYERPETVRSLSDTVDIFLPDLKYYDPELSAKYSFAPDYFDVASKAIREMVRISGKCEFDDRGMLRKGTVVRHMILPGHTRDSMQILRYLYETYGDDIYISIMNQYTPMPGIGEQYPELGRRITRREYDKVVDFALQIGITNAFVQEGETAKESFIPEFDGTGL